MDEPLHLEGLYMNILGEIYNYQGIVMQREITTA